MTRSKGLSKLDKQATIRVTEELINRAKPRDSATCMISEAVKAAIPGVQKVSTDLATIRFTDPGVGKRYIYLTPASAQRSLIQFDQGLPVSPFEFRLKAAAQIIKAGVRANLSRKPVTSDGNGSVPTLREGRPLPRGPLAMGPGPQRGRIRAFGIRALAQ